MSNGPDRPAQTDQNSDTREPVIQILMGFADGAIADRAASLVNELDSLEIVELAKFIENVFKVRVGIEDITYDNFSSVYDLADMVLAKKQLIEKRGNDA
ncbi:hypothetical protein GCM10017691_04390 [Pseudonocardia petroleophila]|uniref:Acyl carrier protein n=1 Tax=Pseudonocardia petroleophila TaxID=37331 RepID=A0A7G7MKK5_9PSEU|nr:hypothetical protein [Pseudonocardia petroleophila]QNG53316.1 hypothetical protein H6H00_04795 [Pseudonocardia petroleophila]